MSEVTFDLFAELDISRLGVLFFNQMPADVHTLDRALIFNYMKLIVLTPGDDESFLGAFLKLQTQQRRAFDSVAIYVKAKSVAGNRRYCLISQFLHLEFSSIKVYR